MTGFAGFVAGLAALSAVVTSTLYVARGIFDKQNRVPAVWLNVAALVVGVAYCLGWQIDITSQALALVPALAGNASRLTGVAGQVLTGLTVGALSGFFHEVLDALRQLAGKGPRFAPAPTMTMKAK